MRGRRRECIRQTAPLRIAACQGDGLRRILVARHRLRRSRWGVADGIDGDRHRRRRGGCRSVRYRKRKAVRTVVVGRRRIGHRIATQAGAPVRWIRRQHIRQTAPVRIATCQGDGLRRILVARHRLRRSRWGVQLSTQFSGM